MRCKDYTNIKINYLTGISPTKERAPDGSVIWNWKCDCGKIIKAPSNTVKAGRKKSCGCKTKKCFQESIRDTNIKKYDYIGVKFNKLTGVKFSGVSKGGMSKWLWKCDCGNVIEAFVSNVRSGHTKSCGCLGNSVGEYEIETILKKENIKYKKEFIFNNFKNARFDFAIFNNQNVLLYIIEYDGEQHFNYRAKGWNNKNNFQTTRKKDLIKNKYCFENNIPLIRIPYNIKWQESDLILNTTRFLLTKENERNYYNNGTEEN